MPRREFEELIRKIKKSGKSEKMSKRDFIWLFDHYQKRTSGNVWRINEYLRKEKMIVTPDYQQGWIDTIIIIKEKDKVKIKNKEYQIENDFDPINRLSIFQAASKEPVSIERDAPLEKAFHLLWKHGFTQIPVMNNNREILGIISWQTIAKGLIAKKESKCVKDFMTQEFTILNENTPLFDAIKEVMRSGIIFVKDKEKKIKGPVTSYDLNEEFTVQIEPFILLEQIENYIRLILNNKIVFEDLRKILKPDDKDKKITSLSDMTFGQYIRIIENGEMWNQIGLPFVKSDFVNELHEIRSIRNGVMHFHPDKTSNHDLELLRRMSKFLMDFNRSC